MKNKLEVAVKEDVADFATVQAGHNEKMQNGNLVEVGLKSEGPLGTIFLATFGKEVFVDTNARLMEPELIAFRRL
jgi:hypothetical protein